MICNTGSKVASGLAKLPGPCQSQAKLRSDSGLALLATERAVTSVIEKP